ncbi:class I SAM-dependent rRNA methyltransferase [Myxococcota bacterium]|nr:class I SAM-dependent rRNA methyltransferase [Myxococcota bacterium]
MIPTVVLRPGAERRVARGHAWVFSNELHSPVTELPPGGAVAVRDARGRFLGLGHANPSSLIAVRILSRDPRDDLDGVDFYAGRIQAAWQARRLLLPGRDSVRVVAGDADLLSGLVVDRYAPADGGDSAAGGAGAILSVQLTSLGMELRRDLLAQALQRVLSPAGAVLRGDVSVRALEGLPQQVEDWFGAVPAQVIIAEGTARFRVDPRQGQKTGFFLDQVDNRAWGAARASGARVLDAYAHTGAWAIQALLAGASSAVALDVSERACAMISAHAADNGLSDRLQVLQGDARQVLGELAARGERFDLVFLDPPAFAKTRKAAAPALKAYRQVNRLGMALVKPGGLLFTSSCSHHIHEERFLDEVAHAAHDLGRPARIVRRGEQAPDHPVHPAMPETRYLKHLVLHLGDAS